MNDIHKSFKKVEALAGLDLQVPAGGILGLLGRNGAGKTTAISHGAELWILDEPMEGLDPAANDDVLRELVDLAASEGTTVFFSSHQIADVEQIADHVSIINQGASLVAGALDDMKMRYQRIQIPFPDGPPASVPISANLFDRYVETPCFAADLKR